MIPTLVYLSHKLLINMTLLTSPCLAENDDVNIQESVWLWWFGRITNFFVVNYYNIRRVIR